jgi:hypothetical protein
MIREILTARVETGLAERLAVYRSRNIALGRNAHTPERAMALSFVRRFSRPVYTARAKAR